ncbi:hypothetical protein ABT124_51850, partial [Streptomyces sp. NPDC001982]|uniref:hypothetical protein n=1 Tax=Streptomyces sp. NPDC001982 TaxID=3154405 RepID=UPI003317C913
MRIPGVQELCGAARSAAIAMGLREDRDARRLRCFDGRVHIAVRGLLDGDADLAAAVQDHLAALPCVQWAAVNTTLGHAVVAVDGPPDSETTVKELVDAVGRVEEARGLEGPLPQHPLSPDPVRAAAVSLAWQVAAAPVAATAWFLRRTPVPAGLASLATVVDTQPQLRRLVERTVGTRNAGVVLAGVNAAANAASGGAEISADRA